jgi:hypothetical protein
VILPLRTAATTAALRRATHRVVLGGGRSSIAEDRCTDGSMMLFSRFERRSWTRPIDRSLTAISVDEIGWLPPDDSGRGHSRLIAALMQNIVPYRRVKDIRNIPLVNEFTR